MRYFSTFSGIGGFEIGIQNACNQLVNEARGQTKPDEDLRQMRLREVVPTVLRDDSGVGSVDEMGGSLLSTDERWLRPVCVGYSEIDKYAIKVYERQFNGHKNYGDITKINADELPDFDVLVGGFPCQAFSIAGKRAGFEDTRGTLFFDLARILKAKTPRLFVFENVKGLLSHNHGHTFKTIIAAIDELGYDCQWQVLNSKNHGVPQNRERVIFVGHLRGTSRPEVFPITETDRTTNEGLEPQNTKGEVASTVRSRYGNGTGSHIRSISQPSRGTEVRDDAFANALRANGGGAQTPKIIQLNHPTHSNDRVYGTDGISPTINTAQGGNRQPFVAPVLTPDRPVKRQNGRRFKEDGEPSFTLTGQDRHGVMVACDLTRRAENNHRIRKDGRAGTLDANYYKGVANQERPGVTDGVRIRRLTPLECERLQGFPDNWTKYGEDEHGVRVDISDSQRYKMCGNAVTTNVIQDVFERILASERPQ
jgi:DNA (cytosine-5)-methyltransferase 1